LELDDDMPRVPPTTLSDLGDLGSPTDFGDLVLLLLVDDAAAAAVEDDGVGRHIVVKRYMFRYF